jgi:shikimate kinase
VGNGPLSISLIGMPGGGKSTVGRHLAHSLKLPFVDSDVEIERRIGSSIRSYFEKEGEQSFRDIEEATIADLLARTNVVLATGGGAVLREANRRQLRTASTVIYLHSSPDELFRRLRRDTQRPLLQVKDPLQKLRDLFHERDPLYRETAQFVVETGRPSVVALTSMILMQLELAGLIDAQRVPSRVDATRPPR